MNLNTKYLGLDLKNPLVPSAGPLSQKLDSIKAMEDAGAAAVVMYSLFEEEIEHDALELNHHTSVHNEAFAEATSFFPDNFEYNVSGEQYLEQIRKAKAAVSIPVIGSLNGKSSGGWIDYAKKIEQAGADALELNIYMLSTDMKKTAEQIEDEYINVVKEVVANTNLPVAVKLSPYFTSVSNLVSKIDKTGAKGVVLFNRFYQPDIDLEKLEVVPNVILSTPMDLRLPLRWTAIMYGRINADIAATSGIYTEQDVLKMIMAGAKVTQMLSALLKFGPGHITEVLTKLTKWMEEHEYESLDQMRGSMSYMNAADPSQFERANYAKVLHSWK